MNKLTVDFSKAVEMYKSGKHSVKSLAKEYGVSSGKMYYVLKEMGCPFTSKRKKPMSKEEIENRSKGRKGKRLSLQHRRAIGEKNSCNYNGMNGYGHTKKHPYGYILAYVPKHPNAHKDGYVMLHTVFMERAIGRYLNDNEVVHHVNHDRTDNRIENLLLMDKKEHMSMHMKERRANERKERRDL